MKCIINLIFVLAICAQPTSADSWKLVWSDEFDVDGRPDPAKWGYEQGFVRNQEMQYYTKDRPENARVENGMLIIEGRKEQFKNPDYDSDAEGWQKQREYAQYTAASLVTWDTATWRYGRVEVRAKLPEGKGAWPAIWMLGEGKGWPEGGEIDIMEWLGREPNVVHATVHYAEDGKHTMTGDRIKFEAPNADFHIYAIEWNAQRIDFFFDDTRYFSFSIDEAGEGPDNPFRQPFYLLINLALGGSWGGEIDPDLTSWQYLIDYVRVYELAEVEQEDAEVDAENQP